ncbi:MAG TPA: hypothetical protein PK184_19360 [Phycisphaerae bacterium]|nr:hypothetical protein [Phycisphaerae bacterium]
MLVDPRDRGFWAMMWLSILSLQRQEEQNPFRWETQLVTVPDSVNLDTFDWNMGVF